MTYHEIINEIKPLDQEILKKAYERLDCLIKPIGSLGKLEKIAAQICGITGEINNTFTKKSMIIMCADNGIWEEGISPCPQSFTAIQSLNFTKGICGINVLAKHAGMDIRIIDIGIKADIAHPLIINKKIGKGTRNMAKGPAMTREEAERGINIGVETVNDLVDQGYAILGTGEMGICNTSTSSAILMAFTGCDSEVAVGRGIGLSETVFSKKKQAIEKALKVNQPDPGDPLDVLAKVGGFDIAGLTGCYLGAAYRRVPIIIDGFISAAAALVASKINPYVKDYMIPSHCSAEPGFKLLMNQLGLEPLLNLEMRLGEGTGCPLALNLIEAAVKIMTEMGTFDEASISNDFLVDNRMLK